MTCRFAGAGQPRVVTGRHDHGCNDEACPGCQPCHEPHCRVCRRVHADGACAECLADARETLRDIARMCDSLPTEVFHKGAEGEAMMLLGPTADVEHRNHVEASYLAGRLPEGWIEASHGKECPILRNEACVGCAGGEKHPLTILATWQDVYAEEFEHEVTARATVRDAAGYLDRNLTYTATWPHVPFEDFVQDLRRCRSHLEAVLHDGEQVENGAPCPSCDRPLLHTWGARLVDDQWRCMNTRCDVEGYTTAQYRGWVEEDARNNADRLTAQDMALRFAEKGLKASVVRVWGTRGIVKKRGHDPNGMTLYDVDGVEARVLNTADTA